MGVSIYIYSSLRTRRRPVFPIVWKSCWSFDPQLRIVPQPSAFSAPSLALNPPSPVLISRSSPAGSRWPVNRTAILLDQPNPAILRSLHRGSAPEGVTIIKVIDAIMGKGKTTFLIDRIRRIDAEDQRKRWESKRSSPRPSSLWSSALLEVDRFTAALPDLNFRDPQPVEGRKLHHLKTLRRRRRNIVTTHALFRMLDRGSTPSSRPDYVLIIDEVLDAVEMFSELTAPTASSCSTKAWSQSIPTTKRLSGTMGTMWSLRRQVRGHQGALRHRLAGHGHEASSCGSSRRSSCAAFRRSGWRPTCSTGRPSIRTFWPRASTRHEDHQRSRLSIGSRAAMRNISRPCGRSSHLRRAR